MERRLTLEGCHNFRDLGGYPTADGRTLRWRELFRSDALHLLTAADVSFLRDDVRLAHVVDLRSTHELQNEGRGPLQAEPVAFHHLPLFDGAVAQQGAAHPGITLADRYFLMAEFARQPIARVIETLASAGGPSVYHCAAGKDRTGVISAILLGVLGVRDDVIVADYVATQEGLEAIVERLLSSEGYQEMLAALPPDTMHAEPETMVSLLDRVRDRYGSMRGYALAIGVSEESLARLEERLLTR